MRGWGSGLHGPTFVHGHDSFLADRFPDAVDGAGVRQSAAGTWVGRLVHHPGLDHVSRRAKGGRDQAGHTCAAERRAGGRLLKKRKKIKDEEEGL